MEKDEKQLFMAGWFRGAVAWEELMKNIAPSSEEVTKQMEKDFERYIAERKVGRNEKDRADSI